MTQTLETPPARRNGGGTSIQEPLARENLSEMALSQAFGGVRFSNMIEVMDFAKLMALSDMAVPKHLRNNPGACLAIVIQAVEMRISPYALANKSYCVNERLAYESALYHAVALKRAPIQGRIKCEYAGEGTTRVCRVWAKLADGSGDEVSYESPKFGTIPIKNSPLWKNDPDQQLFYYSVRAWCRRHFPDVMMGIYTQDELIDGVEVAQPAPQISNSESLADKLRARGVTTGAQLEPAAPPEQSSPRTDSGSPQGDTGGAATIQEEKPSSPTPSELEIKKIQWCEFTEELERLAGQVDLSPKSLASGLKKMCVKLGIVGKEWEMPAADRDAARESVKNRQGYFA